MQFIVRLPDLIIGNLTEQSASFCFLQVDISFIGDGDVGMPNGTGPWSGSAADHRSHTHAGTCEVTDAEDWRPDPEYSSGGTAYQSLTIGWRLYKAFSST
jgi:hypothetical protein